MTSNEVLGSRIDGLEKRMDSHDNKCDERMKVLHAKIDKLTHIVFIGYGLALAGYVILLAFGKEIFG